MHESNGSSRTRGWVGRLLREECGGEAVEYALIVGLILITAIAVVSSLGNTVLAR